MERIGQRLGHYRLSRLIGQGGFADVYLGEHIHLKSYAAIKIMHTRLTSELQDSFLNEARTLALLVHPRIIRVLDFGIDQQTAYLVMDYAPHGTLRQRHPTGVRLSPQTVAGYLDQIAAGLHYAHHQKLIHRDLKPDNVLINAQHDLQIADFGVALIVQTTQPLKTSEEFAGTVTYMAPEQLLGKPQFASDQYALGIMAYEWLSGCRPFEGTFTELFIQHQHTPPTSLCELVPGLPPAINQVVLTALDKDPTRRFSTIKAFASAFSAAVAQAYPSTALARPEESFSTVHMSLAYQEAQPVHTSGNAASRSAEAISASALSTGPVSRPASVAPLHTPVTRRETLRPISAASAAHSVRASSRKKPLALIVGSLLLIMAVIGLALSAVPQLFAVNSILYPGISPTLPDATYPPTSTTVPAHSATPRPISTHRPSPTAHATPTRSATPSPTSLTPTPTAAPASGVFSFEDGSTTGWIGLGNTITSINTTTDFHQDGSRSLTFVVNNNGDTLPSVVLDNQFGAPMPQKGQTVSGFVYRPWSARTSAMKAHIVAFSRDDPNGGWQSNWIDIPSGRWTLLAFTIPDTVDQPLAQIGIQFNTTRNNNYTAYMDNIRW